MTTINDHTHNAHTFAASEKQESRSFVMADLPDTIQKAASHMGWTELMPVQTQTIPLMLQGQDIMVQSHTGSGKTGAFLLPILTQIDPDQGVAQALVLAPTRELAIQVCKDAKELTLSSKIFALPIYGGVGYRPQIQGLEKGAQLIVGTPGRILDHLLKGTLTLDHLKILVFDEADRMLSMGFYPDMKQLQRYLPPGLQSTMFSATYPGHVQRLAQQFLKDPVFVSLSQDQVHASDVLHVVYKVPAMQKSRILVKIIEQENPASGIIFCNTKTDVHFVTTVLRRFGYDVGEISADLSQGAREEVLEKLRQNKLKFLVATDVAARGIDIHELSHVFQYQPPQDHEAYIHRTGRTGRAGAAGIAISLVSGMEEIELEQIAKKFSITLEERQVPEDKDLELLISQRAVSLLESQVRKADNIQKERMQRFMRTVVDLADNEDSRALLAMLIDEFYQKTFHAPLEEPLGALTKPPLPVALSASPEENGKTRRKRSKRKPATSTEISIQDPKTENNTQQQNQTTPAPASRTLEKTKDKKVSVKKDPGTQLVPTSTLGANGSMSQEEIQGGMDSIWDNDKPASDALAESPKKRRRRRPRKPSTSQVENNTEQSKALDPETPNLPQKSTPRDKEAHSPKTESKPMPKPTQHMAEQQEKIKRNGKEIKEKPASSKKPQAKSNKKIFLE
ncbi:MAG: DEAD/DEAH box helicase [Desulfovibrionales bacterium]|nr:DEAD/DEAH box helicase [Desulfovibrionales bacterium]